MRRNVNSNPTDATVVTHPPNSAKQKEQIRTSLSNIVETVIPLVEGVAKLHPCADACVTTLTKVLQYEIDRRDNDEQIARVLKSMAKMVATIQYLRPAVMEVDHLVSELKTVLDAMNEEMQSFEQFATKYYGTAAIFRRFFAKKYKARLLMYTAGFKDHHDQIIMVLGVRTDKHVKEVRETLYTVEAMVRDMHTHASFAADSDDPSASEKMAELLNASIIGAVAEVEEERKAAKSENEKNIKVPTQELKFVSTLALESSSQQSFPPQSPDLGEIPVTRAGEDVLDNALHFQTLDSHVDAMETVLMRKTLERRSGARERAPATALPYASAGDPTFANGRTTNSYAAGGKTPALNWSSKTPNSYAANDGKTPAWATGSKTPTPGPGGDDGFDDRPGGRPFIAPTPSAGAPTPYGGAPTPASASPSGGSMLFGYGKDALTPFHGFVLDPRWLRDSVISDTSRGRGLVVEFRGLSTRTDGWASKATELENKQGIVLSVLDLGGGYTPTATVLLRDGSGKEEFAVPIELLVPVHATSARQQAVVLHGPNKGVVVSVQLVDGDQVFYVPTDGGYEETEIPQLCLWDPVQADMYNALTSIHGFGLDPRWLRDPVISDMSRGRGLVVDFRGLSWRTDGWASKATELENKQSIVLSVLDLGGGYTPTATVLLRDGSGKEEFGVPIELLVPVHPTDARQQAVALRGPYKGEVVSVQMVDGNQAFYLPTSGGYQEIDVPQLCLWDPVQS